MILSDKFPSSSSSKEYTAQYDTSTGKGTCNCPGWTKRAVRECKHTKDLAKRDASGVPTLVEALVKLPADPFQGFREPPAIKPMLASAMPEGSSIADYSNGEWILEEKFDGHRLLVVVSKDGTVVAWSRPGHDRPAAQRTLPETLSLELAKLPDGTYDGELYIPSGTSSDVVRLDRQDDLRFVLFDLVSLYDTDTVSETLTHRRALLVQAWMHTDQKRVHLAVQDHVSLDRVRAIWKRGGEGAILKRKASVYKSGWRTPDWIKVKQIDAAEFTVTGFDEGKSGPCSVFKLRHDDGRETTCKVLTNDLLRAVHKDPQSYIGRRLTISHMGFTKSGLWRHPVFDHFV